MSERGKYDSILTLVVAALVVRVALLPFPALVDPSEARFASSAVHMLQTGDWVTPKIHENTSGWIPYLAKPPFHVWLTALSLKVFGLNEFAARFPSFVGALVIVVMLRIYSMRFLSGVNPWLAPCVFLTSTGVFLTGFSAITDMTLSACFTVAIVSAAIALDQRRQRESRGWGHLFFIALGVGTLTKGPVILILATLVIGAWVWVVRNLRGLKQLPWRTGVLGFVGIVFPWYIAAEHASRGFLYYFIFEENFRRYFSSAYQFRYGSVHPRPFGTIWLVMLAMSLPWVFILKTVAWQRSSHCMAFLRAEHGIGFAVVWGLAPIVFFTFSRQILATYCLPALPGLSMVVAAILHKQQIQSRSIARLGVASLIIYAVLLLSFTSTITEERSTRPLLSYFRSIESTHPLNVVFLYRDPFSTHFYAADEAGTWINLRTTLDPEKDRPFSADFVVARNTDLERVSADVRDKLHERIRIGKWVVMTACFLKHSISHAAMRAASS